MRERFDEIVELCNSFHFFEKYFDSLHHKVYVIKTNSDLDCRFWVTTYQYYDFTGWGIFNNDMKEHDSKFSKVMDLVDPDIAVELLFHLDIFNIDST